MVAQHPAARCGKCKNCQYVESTKTIVLAHSAPSGPGITDRERDLWNRALEENPCIHPLVIVHVTHPQTATVKGRIVGYHGPVASVNTAEFGEVLVEEPQIEPWTPLRIFDGIGFEQLAAALGTIPQTWLPAILAELARATINKNVFMPFGASTLIRELEVKLLGDRLTADQTSGLVAARASLRATELQDAVVALLKTTELNLDELDETTPPVIAAAQSLLNEINRGGK